MAAARQLKIAMVVPALFAACSGSPPASQIAITTPPSATETPLPRAPAADAGQKRVLEKPTVVITLPVYVVRNDVSTAPADRLLIQDEKQDQEAEGPQSFDVLADGNIVVADPLRRRLLVFDRRGQMVRAIDVGVPARTVEVAGDLLRIVPTAQPPRLVDFAGTTMRPAASPASPSASAEALSPPQVTLNPSRRVGTVEFASPSGAVSTASPSARAFQVTLDSTDRRLASVRVITVDPKGRSYVEVEALAGEGTSATSFTKFVRRYDADGRLDVEIQSIPTDYFVVPTTEFRVVRDAVYQLVPHREAVYINVWDLGR
jgi:hypothetical protein